jgi:hypothetical protein
MLLSSLAFYFCFLLSFNLGFVFLSGAAIGTALSVAILDLAKQEE